MRNANDQNYQLDVSFSKINCLALNLERLQPERAKPDKTTSPRKNLVKTEAASFFGVQC